MCIKNIIIVINGLRLKPISHLKSIIKLARFSGLIYYFQILFLDLNWFEKNSYNNLSSSTFFFIKQSDSKFLINFYCELIHFCGMWILDEDVIKFLRL